MGLRAAMKGARRGPTIPRSSSGRPNTDGASLGGDTIGIMFPPPLEEAGYSASEEKFLKKNQPTGGVYRYALEAMMRSTRS